MKLRTSDLILFICALVPLTIGLILAVAVFSRTAASLDGVEALLARGKLDQARRRISLYLEDNPASSRANLMLAELIITQIELRKKENPDSKPADYRDEVRRALRSLEKVRGATVADQSKALLVKGKALFHEGLWDQAETAWKEAIDLDPRVPEAAWGLLEVYYLQGREDEAHDLVMKQYQVEPDPRDRANLLLELVRRGAQPPDPASLLKLLAPIATENPSDLPTLLSYGLAFVKNSQPTKGLEILRKAVADHPKDERAWDAFLTALELVDPDALAGMVARLPTELAASPKLSGFVGRVAQDQRDWPKAMAAYRNAWEARPYDSKITYRLSRALRLAGKIQEAVKFAPEFEDRVNAFESARTEIRDLYAQANEVRDLGIAPHPELYERLASLRERMGRNDEAEAWRRLSASLQNAPSQKQQPKPPGALDNVSPDLPSKK